MKHYYLAAVSFLLLVSACTHQGGSTASAIPQSPLLTEMGDVSPAMEHYTHQYVQGGLWKRSQLSPRDRSVITLAALIARNDRLELRYHLNLALDNGVKPGEISEIITHLAFYSGWPSATSAVNVTKEVFTKRGITRNQLPAANVTRLPIDEAAERAREAQVSANFGQVAPGVVQYTTDALFRDLWLRPGLTPRDRSLVTVSALITAGQVEQIQYHLNRAMDNGLTQAQAAEMLTQLAFYAGWPRVFSALPVAKKVFEARNS